VMADLLTKMECKLRPYEVEKGAVDAVTAAQTAALGRAIETKADLAEAFAAAVRAYASVPVRPGRRPLVGIVGEIYVRSNAFCNGDVVRAVERYGGEAWVAPISEWILYTSETARRGVRSGTSLNMYSSPLQIARLWLKDRFLHGVEKKYARLAAGLIGDRMEPPVEETLRAGERYVPVEFEGESILTIGRAILFVEGGAAMVVSANPFGCMPGTIASACLAEVQRRTGVPIVSMFYDGEASINDKLSSFIGAIGTRLDAARPPVRREPRTAETAAL